MDRVRRGFVCCDERKAENGSRMKKLSSEYSEAENGALAAGGNRLNVEEEWTQTTRDDDDETERD